MRRTETARRKVLEMSRTMGKAKKGGRRSTKTRVSEGAAPSASTPLVVTPSKTLSRGTRAQALYLIFATAIRDGEGFRTGALGAPRFGKTFHLQEVIRKALALGICDRVFIHDVKKPEIQYEGATAASAAMWAENIEDYQTEDVVVFHATYPEIRPSVQSVCEVAQAVAAEGQSALVVVDELYKATNGSRFWLKPDDGQPALIGEFLREGSSRRISTAWTTQIPQSVPIEALNLSETCALFHLEGLSANYAQEAYRLDNDAAAALATLARGEFLLFDTNAAWNRTIFGPK